MREEICTPTPSEDAGGAFDALDFCMTLVAGALIWMRNLEAAEIWTWDDREPKAYIFTMQKGGMP